MKPKTKELLLNIVLWPIEKIRPYIRNARTISPRAVDKVAASIKEFGWRQPIVVDRDNTIICGHVRLLAAQKLGLKEIPVHVAENLDPSQVRAYRLLDNRSHEETAWNEELLGRELLDLKTLGLDLNLTGFETDELDDLLSRIGYNGGLADEDSVPEVPATPVSRLGDLWVAGDHRVLCGDAISPSSYERVLQGGMADMVFTDPPYNVNYRPSGCTGANDRIANDNLGPDFETFLAEVCNHLVEVTQGGIYICMSSSEIDTLKRAFTSAGGHWSTFIIWAKNHFTLGRSDYQRQYEPILYGWRQGSQRFWCGDRDQGDVWLINKPAANDLHPTMKPIELVERAVRNSSRTKETVLDPFAGSGSTLIACERTGRCARLIEIDPKYVDVVIDRWQKFTGRVAELCDSGKSFNEVAQER